MAINNKCGHHCGIANYHEGHCGCEECKCPQATNKIDKIINKT